MAKVNYKSPLYIQLREIIRNKIEDEEYLPGTAIPSENQLMEMYGLTRLSVRSALAALEYEGLLKSVQGKGVFVAGPKTERDMDTLRGFRSTMQERKKNASTKTLIKAVRTAGPYYAHLLEIDPEDDVWYIRRIDTVDKAPVALEEIYIPYKRLPNLDDVDIKLFHIYDIYKWKGFSLSHGEQSLRIVHLPQSLANLIDINPEQAVMEFSCITRDTNNKVIEYARNFVRNDSAEFTVHFLHS